MLRPGLVAQLWERCVIYKKVADLIQGRARGSLSRLYFSVSLKFNEPIL